MARKTERFKSDLCRTWRAYDRCNARGFSLSLSLFRRGKERERQIVVLLFHRYVPAQDPIEQPLTPRDDVGANERGRKGRERCGEREEGVRGETSRTRGTRVEREKEGGIAINNTKGKEGDEKAD